MALIPKEGATVGRNTASRPGANIIAHVSSHCCGLGEVHPVNSASGGFYAYLYVFAMRVCVCVCSDGIS